jgi:putative DNA primase/helicase
MVKGVRDDLFTCLTGVLLRGVWSDTEIDALLDPVTNATDDPMASKAAYQRQRLGDGHPVPGIPRLKEIMGKDADLLLKWLVISAETPSMWPDPVDLPVATVPVKALQGDMIPLPLRGWLMDIADRMQIPLDFIAAAVVVALGSVIGRGCAIHPKKLDDWLVVPNLWGMVIGRPSLMKTPAVSEGMCHLARLEEDARQAYQSEQAAYEFNREVAKATKATAQDALKKAVKNSSPELIEQARHAFEANQVNEPVRHRYQTQDGTTEKIGELLTQNHRGLLVNRDELSGFLTTLDKTGREGDRAFYLEAWNGTRGFSYDRIGRGTLDIPALSLSIFGAITPGGLSSYVYSASQGGNGDDGLLQRFQVMVWPDAPGEWIHVDRYPDNGEKRRAWEIFRTLAGEVPGTLQTSEVPALHFTPGGQEVFDAWWGALEGRLRGEHGLAPAVESHLAKYRSLMPSLALIFHLVEVADGSVEPGPVSEAAATMASAWCEYLESHAKRVYAGVATPGRESARELIKHIRRKAIIDGESVRSIYRGREWSRLTTPEEVRAGLKILEEYDWLTIVKSDTGGRPTEIIRLNPKISYT